MTIRTTFYFTTGREQSSHDCDSIESAYERLTRTGMTAHAWPVGTSRRMYIWRPAESNDLLSFRASMLQLARDGGVK